jgi:taurine dioxygenase
MYAAYDSLSERMKAYLDGLTALHDGEPIYRGLYANYGVADRPAYPRAEHPVLRTHPVTGKKALYVNSGFTRHIIGIPRDESDAMLSYLYRHPPARSVRHDPRLQDRSGLIDPHSASLLLRPRVLGRI